MTARYKSKSNIAKRLLSTSRRSRDDNPYKLPSRFSSAARPTNISLQFRGLRANTKYKVFLQNNEGTLQEDVTRFCKPYGKSIVLNNNTSLFDEFQSTPSGELFVKVKPYGTDNVSLTNDDWSKHWKYALNKTKTADVGRSNFIIVESADITNPSSTDKVKDVPLSTQPISIDVEPDNRKLQRKIKQTFDFDYIQTFFVDPNSVNNAKTIDLTDITLYFRNKPERELNRSKRIDPGVTIALVDIDNDRPNIEKQYEDSIVTVDWSFIQPSTDASNGTRFEFSSPVRIEPGRYYAVAIAFEDNDYVLWSSVRGDILVNTEQTSPGASKDHRGVLYERTNASSVIRNTNFDDLFTKKKAEDLKFDVHVAQYDLSANIDIQLVNIDQEFLVVSNTNDNWVGSEYVYKQTANSTGNVAITAGTTELIGTSTTFTNDLTKDSRIVLQEGSNVQIVTIGAVANDTLAYIKSDVSYTMTSGGYKVTPIGVVDHYDYTSKLLFLKESSANSTVYFDVNDILLGVESSEEATITKVGSFPVSAFNSDLDISLPSTFNLDGSFKFSIQDGSNSEVFTLASSNTNLDFFKPNYVRDYEGVVVSRSLEARNEANMYDQDGDANTSDGKSVRFNLDFTYQGSGTTSYESPLIDIGRTALGMKQWKINNLTTNEHTNNGSALTKHISKRLVLEEGQDAEDVRVIQNAYRPLGTDIKVYAKILNAEDPDPFEDKNWTELRRVSGENQFSEKNNFDDFREFEYSFPSTIPSANTLDGTVTTSSGSATVTGVGTGFDADLTAGDVIKIYSEFFEDNYGYFSVVSVNSNTEIVVNEPITNNDILGSGFKIDIVETPQTAFLNPLNLNIVRYFGPSGQSYDGYSTIAIKTILLSENALVTPRVDDSRVISVSA